MTKQKVNVKELRYYDFLAHLGISFFNWGGIKATEELIKMCNIDKNKRVLFVGCGSGYQACYIAKKYGCKVVGIDIADLMIEKARERARILNLEDKVEFHRGDALNIPIEDNSFDILMTEFVSIFLENKKKAFEEYTRVVKKNGFVGINEIFKKESIPEKAAEKVKELEEVYRKVSGLYFSILTSEDWKKFFEEASLVDIVSVEKPPTGDFKEKVESVEGKWKFTKLTFKILYYTMTKGKIGKDLRDLGKVKSILRANKDYIGYILCVGKKP